MPTVRLTAAAADGLIADLRARGVAVTVRGGAGPDPAGPGGREPPPPRPARRGRHPLVEAGFDPPATFLVPVYTASRSNSRGVDAGRSGRERRAVAAALGRHLPALAPLAEAVHNRGAGLVCRLSRLGGTGGMDDDNLRDALKVVRDTVAMFFGLDDSPRAPARWEYGQDAGGGRYGVRIDLRTEGGVT